METLMEEHAQMFTGNMTVYVEVPEGIAANEGWWVISLRRCEMLTLGQMLSGVERDYPLWPFMSYFQAANKEKQKFDNMNTAKNL